MRYDTIIALAEANVALRRYLDSRRDDCPYVFVSERAPYQKLTVRAVQQIVAKLGEKACINGSSGSMRGISAPKCLARTY